MFVGTRRPASRTRVFFTPREEVRPPPAQEAQGTLALPRVHRSSQASLSGVFLGDPGTISGGAEWRHVCSVGLCSSHPITQMMYYGGV